MPTRHHRATLCLAGVLALAPRAGADGTVIDAPANDPAGAPTPAPPRKEPGHSEPLLELGTPAPADTPAPASADGAAPATAEPAAPAAPAAGGSPFHLTFTTEITSAYYFRGIRQEDRGLIVQPAVTATFEAYRSGDFAVTLDAGVWNSFHDRATGAPTNGEIVDKWYECDVSAGVSVAFGNWVMRPFFTWYSSPSDAFEEVYEIAWTVAYDDEHALGALALHPSITIAREVGSNGADGPGRGAGTYLEIALRPGVDLIDGCGGRGWGLRLDFPQTVGLSLSNYYENAAGASQTFGYLESGAKLIATAPTRGQTQWSFWAGARLLYLGDGAREFNRNKDDLEVIGSGGLSVSF